MRSLVIQPEAGNGSVLVGDRLRAHGFELTDVVMSDEAGGSLGVDLGDPTDYDIIVAMGSIRSVYEVDTRSWIADQIDFLRRADVAGVPVFGICFGAQALATAHGGRVVRAERPQIGWHALDESLDGPFAGSWMQWHYDRIEPPAHATLLAADDQCVQAFAVGKSLGVQFHPEVTPDHVAGWVGNGGAEELERVGIDAEQLLADTRAIHADATRRTNRLVDWFLTDVAGRDGLRRVGEPVADEIDEVVVVERAAGGGVDA